MPCVTVCDSWRWRLGPPYKVMLAPLWMLVKDSGSKRRVMLLAPGMRTITSAVGVRSGWLVSRVMVRGMETHLTPAPA